MEKAERGVEREGRPGPSVLMAVAVISLCAVAFEVSLLRLFAFVFRYHYLFLIVSLAICGYGLGALAHFLAFGRPAQDDGRAARFAALFALSLPLTLVLVLRVGLKLIADSLYPVLVLPVVPFICAGLCFAEMFARYGPYAARLYGWDLGGAALAGLAAIGMLAWLGGIDTPLVLGIAAGGAAWLLAGRTGGSTRALVMGSSVVLVGILASNLALGWLDIPRLPPDADPTTTKPLLRELGMPNSPSRVVETRWGPIARVDLVEDRGVPDMKYVYTDGDTPTQMLKFGGELSQVGYLAGSLTFLPFDMARPRSVLAIGPGGGMDVLMARLAGAARVDAVEISGATVDLVHRYRAFNGDPYHLPGVSIHVQDGRSFVASSRDAYDLIYSALTLSATTGRAGMAHTESYIHTLEAYRDYWRHLTPNGVFALVLQEEPLLLRSLMTALAILRQQGQTVAEAMQHLALIQVPEEALGMGPYRRLMLLTRAPITREAARRLMTGIQRRGLHGIYVPYELTSIVPYRDLLSGAVTPEQLIGGYALGDERVQIEPVTDDRPFFVYLRSGLPAEYVQLMAWLAGLSALFAGVPLVPLRRRAREGRATGQGEASGTSLRSRLALLPYALLFALLGAGFMLLEIPLIQQFILFLGHPALSLVVVLFSLLLGTAAGSAWTQRWGVERLRGRVAVGAVWVVVFSLGIYAAVTPLQGALAGTPLGLRAVATGVPIWLLGVGLGMPFPTGLRLVRLRDPAYVPWAWGINGLMSVCGSVLAVSLALLSGFHAAFTAGAVTYAAVAALLPLLPREPHE
jgi:hypothetical protein